MLELIYNKFLNIPFQEREINKLEEGIMRKDNIYELLTKKFIYDINSKDKLVTLANHISQKYNTNTSGALCSYIYALNHQRNDAINTIGNVLELEKGENIDTWIDLAHFLRKIPKYEKLSINILLNLEYFIKKYKNTKNILENIKTLDS